MIVSKYEPLTKLEIWQPRYHDKKVLLACGKVDNAKTKYLKIVFTKAPTMEGDWIIDKTRVKRFKRETNGVIQVYAVPLSELLPLEVNKRDWRELN